MGDHNFEAGRYVARARRRADLSQRDLAARAGVSQSTLAAIESGAREVSVARLTRLLHEGGLRLAVVDGEGTEVRPFPQDAVRDNAGRRFPAHLDVQPPDLVPIRRLIYPRYDREPARGWYHQREQRDAGLGRAPRDAEHPTTEELARRQWELRRPRRARGLTSD